MFNPDQNILKTIPGSTHNTEQDAAVALQGLGQVGTVQSPKWLFRGQELRQPRRKWPPADEPIANKHSLTMEQLLPSDYRRLETRLERGESKVGLQPIYGDRIVHIRSFLTTYLMQCHSCWGDASVQAWFAGLASASKADKLLSIGQHYGLQTHLMDWSSDWEVAIWFASHKWNTGDYIQGGDGVIYQMNVQALIQAEDAANLALGRAIPSQMCRHVDIRDTPALLAPRALAQRGSSIANIEEPCFLQELIRHKALSMHVFPRSATPCSLNLLTKAQLVPPHDEMAVLFDDIRQGGSFFQQAITWVNSNYPMLAPTALDHAHIFP